MAEQRNYRVSQIDGKITWQVEELWDSGVVRGPYGTKDAAIHAEEKFAIENNFLNSLVLKEAIERKLNLEKAFTRDDEGNWTCTQACSLTIDKKELRFSEGLTFAKGIPFIGVDIADWLEKNVKI
ncbi:MAG: hypothetical protein A2158_07720 [Chloroflexi bacterium RBG_13_46_14]|nr:MAG: hypothetical protein A2158_07720 [Chloroflexi bacterium RBG_13_46_14]